MQRREQRGPVERFAALRGRVLMEVRVVQMGRHGVLPES
jgi:hypothetical protein